MGSQFSLSLELTKLVPFGSLVNAAGHGLIRLLREIQASGSDFITEQDLAEIFGRNRVEALFASTFRTAVKHSVIHEISGIAELVIEGGAGPTVMRSLNEPGYFSMIVQLSLLTFTHELTSLTKGLVKAFEGRNRGAKEYVAPPRYDALKGTLRAIREQTCGFMWELVVSAVEKRLYPTIGFTGGSLYEARVIPPIVLQGLLDSFTAIQHLPEHSHLRISTVTGIPTIVVWAHHVLGLSVNVDFLDTSLVFGDGPISIYLDYKQVGRPHIALLNESDDPFFHLSAEKHDALLLPTRRHPLRDYGTRILRLQNDDQEAERRMVESIVRSCLIMARQEHRAQLFDGRKSSNRGSFPSMHQILAVSKLLFAANEGTVNAISFDSIDPSTHFAAPLESGHHIEAKDLYRLSHTVIVLCMTHGFDEGLSLHIDSLEETQYLPFRAPDGCTAFASLASLLEGRELQMYNSDHDRTSVVSAWGWSLCLGSLNCLDPSDAKTEMAFARGMPARGGERRQYIVDGARPAWKEATNMKSSRRSNMVITASPGEHSTLGSWTSAKKPEYFVGITDSAFEVTNIFSCQSDIIGDTQNEDTISMGFRSMQEVSWGAVHLPGCEHVAAIGHSIILPENVWAFHGFRSPDPNWNFPHDPLFAGLVAGNRAARWILTAVMLYAWKGGGSAPHVCIRGRNCCFECAIRYAKNSKPGAWVGLVL
ncbi:MAG: hypothetical protein Q9222_006013 [Ikaeria aurantiellina]